jgi:hypothetical protein
MVRYGIVSLSFGVNSGLKWVKKPITDVVLMSCMLGKYYYADDIALMLMSHTNVAWNDVAQSRVNMWHK